MSKKSIFIAFVVSLGGFLFGFDAGIISGVVSYVGPEWNLTDAQIGWVVSSPSFAAMIAMLVAGKLSDHLGRKKILLFVAFAYAISALLSALATSYEMLYIARMIGGLAFGSALVLAPTYIAEIANASNRGKLVSIQQLNIVFGFFAAFLSNYYLNSINTPNNFFFTDQTVWRWMLGVELLPALVYFILLFFVPRSPRWLFSNQQNKEAIAVLKQIHGLEQAQTEATSIQQSINQQTITSKTSIFELLKPGLRYILIVGLVLGVLQQITGINAVYFYATSIFKQTGIGTDAAFSSGVLLSFTTVIFTFVAIFLIDRMGRRPLLLIGMAGIATSLLVCAYGFHKAEYKLTSQEIAAFQNFQPDLLKPIQNKGYTSDVVFKNDVKALLGNQV